MQTSTPNNQENPNNPAQEYKNEQQQLSISSVIGETCWLISQSVLHRYNFFVADIEWMVIPPILNGHFKLFRSEKKPAAIAFWAYVSDEIQDKLTQGLSRLTPKDWNTGDNLWLIDLIAPYGQTEQLLTDLKKTVFAGKAFKYHRNAEDGTRETITVAPE